MLTICCFSYLALTEGDLIPGALAEGPVPNLPLQEIHPTLIVLGDGGQGPDLDLPASEDQYLVPPGEDHGLDPLPERDQGLVVQDTAVAVSVGQGHDLPSLTGKGVVVHVCAGEQLCTGLRNFIAGSIMKFKCNHGVRNTYILDWEPGSYYSKGKPGSLSPVWNSTWCGI